MLRPNGLYKTLMQLLKYWEGRVCRKKEMKIWVIVLEQKFQEYVKEKWFILPSNTHLVKRRVKDANKCTSTSKND